MIGTCRSHRHTLTHPPTHTPPPGVAVAVSGAHFGRGTGDVLLDDIACFGNESSLLECDTNTTPFCFHFEDAGVISPIPGTVRTWPHHTHYTIHCFSLHCVCDVHYVYNPAFMRPWNGMRIVRARRGRAWEQGCSWFW